MIPLFSTENQVILTEKRGISSTLCVETILKQGVIMAQSTAPTSRLKFRFISDKSEILGARHKDLTQLKHESIPQDQCLFFPYCIGVQGQTEWLKVQWRHDKSRKIWRPGWSSCDNGKNASPPSVTNEKLWQERAHLQLPGKNKCVLIYLASLAS